ncbi:MAG: hypothetical protein ABIY52_14275 [Gemmatimonadaceae bacterium]
MRLPLPVILALAALAACRSSSIAPAAPAPTPAASAVRLNYASGNQLLAAMHDRYAGTWYHSLTFVQKTSRLQPDGKWKVDTWYEAMKVPGRLRIDFAPLTGGNGVVYAHDSAFTLSNGRALPGQPAINPLLLLGFDVYANAPERTAALLRKEKFDLSVVHVDTLFHRPMIVVGARAGDMLTKQFWVDAEHLYFVRTLEAAPREPTKVQDVRFVDYRREGGGWMAPRVEIHTDGKLVFTEEYSDVKSNVALDDALFDPSKVKTTKHWFTP